MCLSNNAPTTSVKQNIEGHIVSHILRGGGKCNKCWTIPKQMQVKHADIRSYVGEIM